jgi:hypothetical protein
MTILTKPITYQQQYLIVYGLNNPNGHQKTQEEDKDTTSTKDNVYAS